MASEKQIAANRANAARSTGPNTPEGKARSSQNAVRHAALGQTVTLRAECSERFRRFVAAFYLEYDPVTPTEAALVDIMASARWRAIRMSQIEAANLDHEFERQQSDPAFENLDNPTRTALAWRELAKNVRALSAINSAEIRLQRQFDSALDRLTKLRARREQVSAEGLIPPTNPISPLAGFDLSDTFDEV